MRRIIYAITFILVFFLFGSVLLPFADADWVMYRSNPSQSSNISSYNVARMPKQTWTSTIPAGYSTSPIVDNGIIYIGTGDGNICALRASSGTKIWNYTLSTHIVTSCPVIAQGIVYICSNLTIYALDASTGEKIWSCSDAAFGSSPAVVDGIVYVCSSGSVYALDALDGSELWNYPLGGVASKGTPVVYEGVVYVGGGPIDRGIYALDALTGEQIWSYTPEWYKNTPWVSAPAIVDGMLFYSTNHRIYGLTLDNGTEVWHNVIHAESSPAVANGMVFLGSGIFGNPLPSCCAFDAKTGRQLWNYSASWGSAVYPEVGEVVFFSSFSDPAVREGVVYFCSSDKNVYALDAATGELVWKYSTNNTKSSIVSDLVLLSPVVGRGEVFVCSSDGVLYAIVTDSRIIYFILAFLLVIVTFIVTVFVVVRLFKKYRVR